MSVYPKNLSNFLNRMSGYNKNNIKMNVLGTNTANQSDIVQVELPSNSIVDLSSLAWAFDLAFAAPGAGGDAHYPVNAESIINRLAVEVNGQTLVNITNYNVLYHTLLYMTATEDFQRQRLVAQANTGNSVASGTSQEVAANGGATAPRRHVIDTWLGFLGSSKPAFIDTSLLGNVRITITLASGEIINGVTAGAAAAPTREYALSNMHFSVDVVTIADGIYDAMVDQMLASGAPIEVPFKNYFSYQTLQQSMTQTTPFNVASQSIDRLWAVARPQDYNAANLAGSGRVATAPQHDLVENNSRFFNFQTCNGGNFQFQINNTMYPQWASDAPQDWFQHTKLAVGDQGNMLSGSFPTSLKQYVDNFFVYACQLEHRTDSSERFVSGIDTRGAAAQCYFKSTQTAQANDLDIGAAGGANINRAGAAVANQITVFAECTSLLRISANKVLEVVQ